MVYKGVGRGKQGCGLGHAPDPYIAVTIESKSIEKKKTIDVVKDASNHGVSKELAQGILHATEKGPLLFLYT